MNPTPAGDSGEPGPRPPKRGEPWPKRFTFTSDGDMRFEKDRPPNRRGDDRRGPPGRPPFPYRGGPGSGRPYANRPPGPPGRNDYRSDAGPARPPFRRPDDFRGEGRPQGAGPGRGFPPRPDVGLRGPRHPGGPRDDDRTRPGNPPRYDDRPRRDFSPRPERGFEARPGGDRPPFNRPSRPWNDRPADRGWDRGPRPPRDRPDRPAFERGPRPFGGSSSAGARNFKARPPYQGPTPPPPDSGPRPGPGPGPGRPPQRRFDRPERPQQDRPWRPEGPARRGPRVFDAASGRRGPREWGARPERPLPPPQSGREDRFSPSVGSGSEADSAPATRLELAERILAKATPTIPADLLLRQTLARRKMLSRADSAWISRAVFSVFRWRGWLDRQAPVQAQIEQALALADEFAMSPANIPEADLLARTVPEWTRQALDVTVPWVRSLQSEPVLWLRARTGMKDAVQQALGSCDSPASPAFSQALRYDGEEDLFRHELFQAGAFEIQDLASQAVGLIAAPQPGETWWDACAGEGGKTLHLSDLMGGKGLVWSSDRAQWRLSRLKQRAGRAGCFNYRSVLWNGGPKPPTKTVFDGVLVDAPCSGIGTWGRNPHARWSTEWKDVEELAVVQRDLLSNAAASVKPGGRLIYAVCTLSRQETVEVADAFAATHAEFTPLPFADPFQPEAAHQDRLLLWPQTTGGNGMFVAAWQRRAEEALPPVETEASPIE